MLRSRVGHGLMCCMLLFLVSVSRGESRPHVARDNTPEADHTGSQKALLLEAVKTGILSSLGMDAEPRPTQTASEQDLKKMYRLYRDKLREIRGNSSRRISQTWQVTVLHPATVEPLKLLRRGEHPPSAGRRKWYRAVFHKNTDILSELTLARAELKISRQILARPTSIWPSMRHELKVKINGRNVINSDSLVRANVSHAADVMDISPEVEKWMGANGQTLVVDVGMIVSGRDALKPNPTISLETGLKQSKPPQRSRRSNKEDECDERGWCCRKSMTVSFKDIGWTDWVVAPAEYTMHYCDGSCPHSYKPAGMHTQVKSRLHQITKGATPGPCCVPAAYEPMVLMHYDSRGKLKLTPFTDMIVTRCYCA